ncbi:MAG: KpsF/GutQ family sugar-phosphate isomerase [Acidobacteria bacterium]|nr:KpsF/GutQ family sugar-phosphate isomerase [Acidobacteriota bacterium]
MAQDKPEQSKIIELGKKVLSLEANALLEVASRLNGDFALAVKEIAGCKSKIICSGMGKAGLIAQKVASTFASTGIPAFFLHPAEAMHGDLGMAASGDVALIFSNSGESEEIVRLLPHLRNRQVLQIAITATKTSSLGRNAEITLEMGVLAEACPLQLAPSSSTTALLALGDALALTVLEIRGFTSEEYARLHPGGTIGRLVSQVQDLMRTDLRCPKVQPETTVKATIAAISRARAGLATVVDKSDKYLGVFTDGDFRRHWENNSEIGNTPVGEIMTRPGTFVKVGLLVRDAKNLMVERHINALPVLDYENKLIGLLDLQDIV